MRYVGSRVVDISTLVVNDNFDERLTRPHVADLAETLKLTGGPIHMPVVDAATMRVVAGEDRIAASCINGEETMEVRLAEGTPRELAILAKVENLHRRHDDKAKLTRELVDLFEAKVVAAPPAPTEAPKAGRPKTPRGQARALAAEAMGTTVAAVTSADLRAAPAPPATPLFALQTWGHGVEKDDQRDILDVLHQLDLIAKHYVNIQGIISKFEKHHSDYGRRLYQRLYRFAHQGADDAKGVRPCAICPLCYQGALMPRCKCCKGSGWITAVVLENLPPDMRNGHNAGRDVEDIPIAAEPGVVPVDEPPAVGTFDQAAEEEEDLM